METPLAQFKALTNALSQHIIGQNDLILKLQIALLSHGHLLVESAPGLAKTTAIKALAQHIDGEFQRIQCTPDLLPSDITGTDIFQPQEGTFHFQAGPLFHSIILVDEINRAPAKVQSALLEAMAERQISVGKTTHPLPELFFVMATQNPLEHEGTFPLPEAQLDRFLLHVTLDYPSIEEEKSIIKLNQPAASPPVMPSTRITQSTLKQAQEAIFSVHINESLEDYIVHLVAATRYPERYDSRLAQWIRVGASPRASIAFDRCTRALAWLQGRDYVTPDDIQALAPNILRHRILLSFEAEAEGMNTNACIQQLLQHVPIP